MISRASVSVALVAAIFTSIPRATSGARVADPDLWQALLNLKTTASALHITAHPDDEDGPALTYLARGTGVRVGLLTINRGEGGADLIAPFAGDALGVLRTLESEQATRHYGVSQFFTRVADYGYSKTLDEALRKWGEDDILRDAVRVIRRERPDIIFSRFRGDAAEGHATTFVVERIARLAFDQAGDPLRFPEQLREGLQPWQPRKLYVHATRPDGAPRLPALATVTLPAGDFDPVLGESYAQLARRGYQMYRTQGAFGRITPSGPFDIGYQFVKANLPGYRPTKEMSFFDGLDMTVQGLTARARIVNPPGWLASGLRAVSSEIETAISHLDFRRPDEIVPALVRGLAAARELRVRIEHDAGELEPSATRLLGDEITLKERQFQTAVARALSLDFSAEVEPGQPPSGAMAPFLAAATIDHVVPGETFGARLRLVNRSSVPVRARAFRIDAPDGWLSRSDDAPGAALGFNQSASSIFRVTVPAGASVTRPNWSRSSAETPKYQLADETQATLALPAPPVRGKVELEVLGARIEMETPVRVTRFELLRPPSHSVLAVAPAIGVRFVTAHGVVATEGRTVYRVGLVVHSNVKGEAKGMLSLGLPEGWTSSSASVPFSFAREDDEATFQFAVSVPPGRPGREYEITAAARYQERDYTEGYQTITAPDLDRLNSYERARHRVSTLDIKVPADLRVGYIMGVRDSVPQALSQVGINVEQLGPTDVATTSLERFDAIVLGIRAYAVRPDVKAQTQRLLDYVKAGGVLLVQYQTPEFDHNFGPYPYSMTTAPEEVCEEDAPIDVLAPRDPIFNQPNRITSADFDGWVDERGSKFLVSWDPRYEPLLQTGDQGQAPQRGGLLQARYGEGRYVYNAYALHKQLARGVPGAFRIYVNLLSLGRTRPRA